MAPITRQELDALPLSYATPCLGLNAAHKLEDKFKAMQESGFDTVELGFGNYVAWVRSKVDLPPSTCPEEWKVDDEPDPSDDVIWTALFNHADALKSLADHYALKLGMLQPLNQFDGWPRGHERGEWSRRKASLWLKLCSELGVGYLQVGANDQIEEGDKDNEKTAEDMAWLADEAAKQPNPVIIAYEPWCFSHTHPTWEKCYEVVKKAVSDVHNPPLPLSTRSLEAPSEGPEALMKEYNRANLGLCLDSAQMALSPDYGYDPTSSTPPSEQSFQDLLERIRALPKEDIAYFEISDVLAPSPPLLGGSKYDEWHKKQGEGNPTRSSWVLCARVVPYVGRGAGSDVRDERDLGVARVAEVAKAVFDTGYRGPVVWEPFEALLMEKEDQSVPATFAKAGRISKEKLYAEVAGST
ncbi:hypothetical protein I317_01703 [Kwoniella heveanensis CBS 569]|nr:hypothetical protein I317_01703 [Kwoniella heveanensis CBS 569]